MCGPSSHSVSIREVGSGGGVETMGLKGSKQRKQRQDCPRCLQIRTVRDITPLCSYLPRPGVGYKMVA